MSAVTTADVEREIKRLGAVYRPPSTAPAEVARIWAEVLDGVSADDFRSAVGEYLRGPSRYFPRPAAIRELATERRQSRGETPQDLQTRWNRWSETTGEPCPVCGAKLIVLEAHWGVPQGDIGRYGTLHDPARHNAARIPHAGYPQDAEYVKQVNGSRARMAEERAQRRDRHLPASVVEPVREAAD